MTSIPNVSELMREATAFNAKVTESMHRLRTITDEQVEIATTPKDEILRTDRVTLYRTGRSRSHRSPLPY